MLDGVTWGSADESMTVLGTFLYFNVPRPPSPCRLLIPLPSGNFAVDSARPKNVFVGAVAVVFFCKKAHCEVEATDVWRVAEQWNASHAGDCSSMDAIPAGSCINAL